MLVLAANSALANETPLCTQLKINALLAEKI